MRKETIELEKLRQKIQKALNSAGSTSDYIDYGKPNAKQLKDAQEQIAQLTKQSEDLKIQLRSLIQQSPPEVVAEWIDFHKSILQRILSETDSNGKVRRHVANETLQEWEKVARREQEYVNINWYYLKDYQKEAENMANKNWWKIWS